MDFTKTIINAIKIWVNKQLSFIENKIADLENRPSAFIQPEEPSETPDGTLWIDLDEESSDIIEIEIDSELNETSENPVQNKVINAAINNLNNLIGDTAVAEQIENAIAGIPEAPVTSVNGQTGDIVINIPSVEGLATETYVNNAIDNIEMPEVPVTSVNGMTGDIYINIPTVEGLATEEYVNEKAEELQENIDAVASAVELLTNGVDAETVDSVNDLIAYVNEHGTEVTGMKADIKANADALAELAPVAKTGSWNDLSDKPFGEEQGILFTVAEHQELTLNRTFVTDKLCAYINTTDNNYHSKGIPSGQYLVVFDGESYIVDNLEVKAINNLPANLIGNPYLGNGELRNGVDYEDNGLPFLILWSAGGRPCALYAADSTVAHTIEVHAIGETTKCIDEKYIPDTIARVSDIPIVDLTSYETKADAESKLAEAKSYTDEAVGAITFPEVNYPVTSVNGQTGDVVIEIPSTDGLATEEYVNSAITNINTYYTKAEIDNMEFITLDEIDAICARTIEVVTPTTGTF